MRIDVFLEQLKARFDAQSGRTIVRALRSEPLAWKALEDSQLQSSFLEFANNDPRKWQVGSLALFMLDSQLAESDLRSPEKKVPPALSKRAQQSLETMRMTGLEPGSLIEAALLALRVREYFTKTHAWKGAAEFLASPRNNLKFWLPAFACLPAIVPDLEGLLAELLAATPKALIPATANLILHALESQPLEEEEYLQTLAQTFADAGLDFQLACLTLLQPEKSAAFIEQLASSFLLQQPLSLDESRDTTSSFAKVEECQKMARISQLAGQPQQARGALDQAFASLNANQARILRELAVELEKNTPEEAKQTWEEVIRLAPDNTSYARDYAEFLLASGETEHGKALLEALPDGTDQSVFSLRYPSLRQTISLDDNALMTIRKPDKSVSLTPASSRFSQDSDALIAAKFAYEHKKYALAAEFIDKALEESPNDLEIIRLAGQIHQHLAAVDKAIESAALVALFEPDNMANKKAMANLFLQIQEPDKALDIFKKLVSSTSEPNREDLLAYADVAIRAGKPDLAIPISENFLAKDPLDGEALVSVCSAYIAKGDEAAAVALLERTSAVAPEKPASWLALAKMWTRLGDTTRAMDSLKKAKAALPEHPEILSALGQLYLDNDKITEAIAVLKQAYALDPSDPLICKPLARAYLQHGYLNEAWTVLRPLENEFSSDPDLALTLGKTLLALGDSNSAKPMLRFAWQSSRAEEALKIYARLLLEEREGPGSFGSQDQQEMQALLDAALEYGSKEPFKLDLNSLSTDLMLALGQLEKAYDSYLELLDTPEAKSPRSYQHLQMQLGRTALALGRHDISLAALQEALLVNPDDLQTRHVLAEAYVASDLLDQALSTARTALQLAPNDLDNILWYSDFSTRHHNEREAIQVLRDAIHLQPDERALYLSLARIQMKLGETEATKDTLREMLENGEISTEEYVNVANIYLHMNELDEASAVIKQAIAQNPSPDFTESRDLAYSVLRLGDAAAALHLLQGLESSLGTHPAYPILQADLLASDSQFLPALQTLEPLLRKLEFSTEDFNFNVNATVQDDRDIPSYTKAGIYYRAAQLNWLCGDMAAAQKHASAALTLEPSSLAIRTLHAELQFALGKTERFYSVLENMEESQAQGSSSAQLIHLLALNALKTRDLNKAILLRDHFLSRESASPVSVAIKVEIALQNHAHAQAAQLLSSARNLLDDQKNRLDTSAFKISAQLAYVWELLALGIAATDAQDWTIANQCFAESISQVKVNPAANQLVAEYLLEKSRAQKNAEILRVFAHAPLTFDPSRSDERIHEEQISIAGRFISAVEMIPTLKIGQAMFRGQWNQADDIKQYIKNSRQAAQVLSTNISPELATEIQTAFAEDFEVNLQAAIELLRSKPGSAAKKAEELLKQQPENPRLHCILALAEQKRPGTALVSIEKALSLWPNEADWHAIAGSLCKQIARYDDASLHLEEALRLSPSNAAYWQLLGDIKVLEKDLLAAKEYFGKAIDIFPDDVEALSALAIINQRLGEHQSAIACLQRANELDPENTFFPEAIAQSLLSKNDYQAAIEQADQVLRDHPASSAALEVKAKALVGKRQFDEAKMVASAARTIVKDSLPFDLLLIELNTLSDKRSGLTASLQLAEARPNNVDVLNNLAEYYLAAGMQSQAEETLHKSLELDRANPHTLLKLGKIARLNGHLDQALSQLSKAVASDPSLIDAYLEIGQTYQDRREVGKALETYHKAIEMVPNDPRAYMHAASAYKDSRDYANAENMLRQAAKINPNDPAIRRQLAAVVAMNLVNNLQEASKR